MLPVRLGSGMKSLMKFSATGSRREVGITLLGNGVPVGLAADTVSGGATERPTGNLDCEKSPTRSRALGTTTLEIVELATCRVPSRERKKNVRSLPLYPGNFTGPPTVPPTWLRRRGSTPAA